MIWIILVEDGPGGQRYNILVDGDMYYEDVPEETVDRLYDQLVRSGWNNIQIVER